VYIVHVFSNPENTECIVISRKLSQAESTVQFTLIDIQFTVKLEFFLQLHEYTKLR
jgi:hypothetical protein